MEYVLFYDKDAEGYFYFWFDNKYKLRENEIPILITPNVELVKIVRENLNKEMSAK